MNLVVVSFGFQVVDRLLPVGSQNITIIAMQALIDLNYRQLSPPQSWNDFLHLPTPLGIIRLREQSLAQRATRSVSKSADLWDFLTMAN